MSMMNTNVLFKRCTAKRLKMQKQADISKMVIMAMCGVNPMAKNLWWMCVLSGRNGFFPSRTLLNTTRTTSSEGISSTLKATNTGEPMVSVGVSPVYMQYLTVKRLSRYPSIRLPVSPMNIFRPRAAFPKTLYEKNGISMPMLTKATNAYTHHP